MKTAQVASLLQSRISGTFGTATPIIIQAEATECGLACMAMLAGHYGYKADLPALRRKFPTSLKGVTLRNLVVMGGALGLATRALRVELNALSQLRLPCILHWDHSHFVLLTAVNRHGLVIHDPGHGRRRISIADASKHFTGVALEAWPTEQFEKKTEREAVSIWRMVRRTKGLAAAAAAILAHSLLLESVTIAIPIAFQLVIDQVVVTADYDLLALIAIGLCGLLFLKVLLTFIRSRSALVVGSSITLQWKIGLFDRLMQLPLDFFEKRHVGDIVSRFGSLDQIQKTLTNKAIFAIIDGIMSVALMGMMILYGGSLVLIAVISMCLYAVLRGATYSRYRSLSDEALIHEAKENSHFMESVRGAASLKALGLEKQRRSLWINYLVERVGANVHTEKFNLVFQAAAQAIFGLDRILTIYLGGHAILDGALSVGMFIAFLAYKDQFADRINSFLDTAVALRLLSMHGERISDIALTAPEESNSTPVRKIEGQSAGFGSLALRDIAFRYSEHEPYILSGVNIDLPAGACLAITGPSGAGKSTLLKIIGGLIKPSHGEIIFSGESIAKLGLGNFRSQIGFVLQEDRLFGGSIAENIAGFAIDIDAGHLQFCAQVAAIHSNIMRMPMGYDTMVGDMGSSLSGGQRQRIILARALYRKPKVLLLDEATSHLDEENEERVNGAIRQLPITRIIVAHRPSSITMANIVLKVGADRVTK